MSQKANSEEDTFNQNEELPENLVSKKNNIKPNSSSKIIIICLSILLTLPLIAIFILSFLLHKEKQNYTKLEKKSNLLTSQLNSAQKELVKEKKETSILLEQIEQMKHDMDKLNSNIITAKYKKDPAETTVLLFNNDYLDLSPADYVIEINEKLFGCTFNCSGLPLDTDEFQAVITLKKEITTFKKLFEGNDNLIEINLNQMKTGKITDMSEMFSLCRSLIK